MSKRDAAWLDESRSGLGSWGIYRIMGTAVLRMEDPEKGETPEEAILSALGSFGSGEREIGKLVSEARFERTGSLDGFGKEDMETVRDEACRRGCFVLLANTLEGMERGSGWREALREAERSERCNPAGFVAPEGMEEIEEAARERIAKANSMRKGGEDVSVEDFHEALRETAKKEEELEWVAEHLPARPSGVFVEAADAETFRASMIVVECLDGNEMLYVLDRALDYLGDEGDALCMPVGNALELAVHRNASNGGMPDKEKALAHAFAIVEKAGEDKVLGKPDVWRAREKVVDDGCGRLLQDCLRCLEKDGALRVLETLQDVADRSCLNPYHIQPMTLGNEAGFMVGEACVRRSGSRIPGRGKNISSYFRKEDVETVLAGIAERQERRSQGLSGSCPEEARLPDMEFGEATDVQGPVTRKPAASRDPGRER